MSSIDKRLEKLEAKTAAKHRPPAIVHTGEVPDLEAWEEQARENMEKMLRFVKQARGEPIKPFKPHRR